MLPETKISNDLGDIALPYSPPEVLLPPPPPPPDLRITSADSTSASDLSTLSYGISGPLPSPPEDFRCNSSGDGVAGGVTGGVADLDTPPSHYELRIRQHSSDDWDRECCGDSPAAEARTTARRSTPQGAGFQGAGFQGAQPTSRDAVRVLVILQDEQLPPCGEMLERYRRLVAFYALDSRCRFSETSLTPLADTLRTLVLSHARLRRLPASLFQLRKLEVLKLDRNRLEEFPVELSKLTSLKLLCVDHQRPRFVPRPN